MRLALIENNDAETIWVSNVWSETDWPVYFALRLQRTAEWSKEWAAEVGPYFVELHAVAPRACDARTRENATRDFRAGRNVDIGAIEPAVLAALLLSYGVSARLWYVFGASKKKLLREARRQLREVTFLFGFAMDRPVNAIGATGWGAIRGDLLAPLRRVPKSERSEILKTVAKITGE